jgi:hypothetical protein
MKTEDCVLGAISGDIIGSDFEFDNVKTLDFNLIIDVVPCTKFTKLL